MSISTHHIIPEGEQYCIWMDAGVVDYKLCNCQCKCDECAYDAQVRARTGAAQGAVQAPDAQAGMPGTAGRGVESSAAADTQYAAAMERLLDSIGAHEFPSDRLYAANHTWAKADDDGMFIVGIDHFIGTMLSSALSVAISMPSTHIRAMEPYAWIVANGETLAVCSPVSGTIVENNPALVSQSSVINADPYGMGWIARIRPDDAGADALRRQSEMAGAMKQDRIRYERMMNRELQRLQPQSAGTMYDGGIVIDTFEAILGTKKHYEILERFLRP